MEATTKKPRRQRLTLAMLQQRLAEVLARNEKLEEELTARGEAPKAATCPEALQPT
jgi:hypothetical protein